MLGLYVVQTAIYRIPLFVLFFILFKIKKIQIILNVENEETMVVL